MRGSDVSSSPAVPGKCRTCDIMQIYLSGIYYIKSRAMTLSRSPQCRAFSRAFMDEKSLSPLFPVDGGGGGRWGGGSGYK